MLSILAPLLWTILEILVALSVILVAYIKWSHSYWKRRNVPFLPPTFPTGNIDLPFTNKDPMGVQLKKLYDQAKAKGWKHCGCFLFAKPAYVPLDLEYVKNVFTKDFQYFTDRGVFYNEKDDPLSAHLFAIGGVKWRNLRTAISPTFTSGKMKTMFHTLLECELPLIKAAEDFQKMGQPIDIKDTFARFSTNIISSCAFGLEINCFRENDNPFRQYGRKVFDLSLLRGTYVMFLMSFPEFSRKLGLRFTNKDVSDFFMRIVRDTVDYRVKNQVRRKDFLQMLIDLQSASDNDEVAHDGTKLTMNEIAAQCFVFFVAGFETSSTTSTFLLYELSKHQDIQQKVRDEIHRVLAKHDGKVTYDNLHEMKYMDQVIDETLRKHPPFPVITREVVKDYKFPDCDAVLEKGTAVMIPILGIHRDPEYYPDPDKFDPERFSDENKKTMHPYQHLPFGEGPRICIGMRFGLMQLKVGLIALLRNFKFSVNERTKEPLSLVPSALVPTIDGDLWLNIEKVEHR